MNGENAHGVSGVREGDGSLSTVLTHLEALVQCDTQNPPRNLAADSPIFAILREALKSAGWHAAA